jgi:multicomponent Na+:H+ antiporter subunit B
LRKSSEILQTASKLLVPILMVLGIYIFVNGHLSPGGGFQGGAVIATAFVLMLMTNPQSKLNHKIISFVESVSGVAYIFIGILGIVLAGGFLDNHILSLGVFGTILSAGAIPIIYLFVGLKVGSELTSIVSNLQETQNEV